VSGQDHHGGQITAPRLPIAVLKSPPRVESGQTRQVARLGQLGHEHADAVVVIQAPVALFELSAAMQEHQALLRRAKELVDGRIVDRNGLQLANQFFLILVERRQL